MCSSPSGGLLENVTTWEVMALRLPLSQWAIIRQRATVILIGCQREHMAGLIACFHRVDQDNSNTTNTQQPVSMCVTLKVEDGKTHWVWLNNRQHNGLLAASAGHRNRLHLPFF